MSECIELDKIKEIKELLEKIVIEEAQAQTEMNIHHKGIESMYIDPIPLIISFLAASAVAIYSIRKIQREEREYHKNLSKTLKEFRDTVGEIVINQTVAQGKINLQIANEMETIRKALQELWNNQG